MDTDTDVGWPLQVVQLQQRRGWHAGQLPRNSDGRCSRSMHGLSHVRSQFITYNMAMAAALPNHLQLRH